MKCILFFDIKESWYNISRDILTKQIEQYELDEEVQQLTKENIEQIAMSLLDQVNIFIFFRLEG
jgi:hypothetical protein